MSIPKRKRRHIVQAIVTSIYADPSLWVMETKDKKHTIKSKDGYTVLERTKTLGIWGRYYVVEPTYSRLSWAEERDVIDVFDACRAALILETDRDKKAEIDKIRKKVPDGATLLRTLLDFAEEIVSEEKKKR